MIADNIVEGDGLGLFLTLDVFPLSTWQSVKV